MRTSTSNVLITIGGALIVAPLAFLYLSYRLVTYIEIAHIEAGNPATDFHINPLPPEYYAPVVLLIGVACIAAGTIPAIRSRLDDHAGENDEMNRVVPFD